MNLLTDRSLIRAAGGSHRHVLLSFTAPEAKQKAARAPVNVALVIDRSGSMGGRKIALAAEAVIAAVCMLRPTDRFSVVCYDHEVDVVVPSTLAIPEALRNAVARVREVQARGNTDLAGGWLKGCELIAEHLQGAQIGRCLLMTDGLANHGITDHGTLVERARHLGSRGIATSTFGVGSDFDERLLSEIATSGAGNFYYIETPVQIADLLTSELGETLEVVAQDVEVRVRVSPGVEVHALNEFPLAYTANGDRVLALGNLVSRQEISLAFRVRFPAGEERATTSALFWLGDAAGILTIPATDIVWTFAADDLNDAQPRNVAVDRHVARLYAARAQEEALQLNRAGRYEEALKRLEATARRIEQYAGGDAELRGIVESLRQQLGVYAAPMSAAMSKSAYFRSKNIAKARTEAGRARRGPTD